MPKKPQIITLNYVHPHLNLHDHKYIVQFADFSDRKPGILQVWQMPFNQKEAAKEKLADLLEVGIVIYG